MGLGPRVYGSGFRDEGFTGIQVRFRVWGLGFRVKG
jgi:hypothetical protein